MNGSLSREQCCELDRNDPLMSMRGRFRLPADQIYLNGNSLGPMPEKTVERLVQVIAKEWGHHLIKSWNQAGWIDMPRIIGNKIARLVGAAENELIVADSTSINLYKALYSALLIQKKQRVKRSVVLAEADNFPSDNYIAQSVCEAMGAELRLVHQPQDIAEVLDQTVAVLLLTEVNYRTAYRHNMDKMTRLAHDAGALVVWDLAHSAGALPVDLHGCDADFAVGCGYKFLCGGPGAPAFIWIHPRLQADSSQPLNGWMGHQDPFRFASEYLPSSGIARFQCGTPPILSMAALDCGVETILEAEALGGMRMIGQKASALGSQLTAALKNKCEGHGVKVISPENPLERGSQVSIRLEGDLASEGYALARALIARGVGVDFRAGDPLRRDCPDIIRFGITPLTLRAVDIFDAVQHLEQVLEKEEWKCPDFSHRERVT